MTKQRITDADYANALAAGRTEAETEIRAQSVRYAPEREALEIITTRNAGFLIPLQWIGALQDVSKEDLAGLELWPDGSAIALEDRDIHVGVNGLLTAGRSETERDSQDQPRDRRRGAGGPLPLSLA